MPLSQIQVKRLSTELRQRADRQVRSQVTGFGTYLAQVVRVSPARSVTELLQSPAVQQRLTAAVDQSQAKVEAAAREAWSRAGGSAWSPYLDALLSDLQATYAQAPATVLAHASRAFRSVPAKPARRPVDLYTVSSSVATANARSAEVRSAVTRLAAQLAVRAGMTVSSAVTRAAVEAQLEQAQGALGATKTWEADFVNNQPCPICTALHGLTVAADAEFRMPPGAKVLIWQDLMGPPAHPYCHCKVKVTRGAGKAPVFVPASASALAPVVFEDIKTMPDVQYSALVSFLRRASVRLGDVLSRLRSALGG